VRQSQKGKPLREKKVGHPAGWLTDKYLPKEKMKGPAASEKIEEVAMPSLM
jgi:hypothetical protein